MGKAEFIADGVLPLAQTALFTAPAGLPYRVTLITLHNTTGVNRVVVFAVARQGGAIRTIYRATVNANTDDWMELGERGLVLGQGDILYGNAAAAAAIDYCVFGEQITEGL